MDNTKESATDDLLLNNGSEEACRKELDLIGRKLDKTMKSIQKALNDMESKFSSSIADMDRDLNKLEQDINRMMESSTLNTTIRSKLDKPNPTLSELDINGKNCP
ncbi:unnamed protein product [Echinostoma caproni]|uniref:Phosphoprotein n=1 Tax=Echinostoma caproni TaxID=27848 RepID=A0A182ZZW1_9TREM|nr:unnamed protein product [Echinostoma caproni]